MRTQAFVKALTLAQHKASLKTIKPGRLAEFVATVDQIGSLPLSRCHEIARLSDTAAHLHAPE
ncbi:hypothetical protein D8I35_05540 [Corticibacter populi]|uniref:Uncharacterized protein n=1 Tax=Corticibacter populi TaxID=1550736 RepID=A0A3M6R0X2_9BURK|nr:hypothetical protein D8I35_05540 [Corticibacter populi]